MLFALATEDTSTFLGRILGKLSSQIPQKQTQYTKVETPDMADRSHTSFKERYTQL